MNKARLQLLVIFGIAFVSLGGSYLLYYLSQTGESWGTTNHGQFVQPAVKQSDLGWRLAEPQGGRTWWIWLDSDGCDDTCRQAVQDMQALHILLNREVDRVRRGFSQPDSAADDWLSAFPQLARVYTDQPSPNGPGIYLIDPLGNFVFFYAFDTNPKWVLEDLKRLLKVSQIG